MIPLNNLIHDIELYTSTQSYAVCRLRTKKKKKPCLCMSLRDSLCVCMSLVCLLCVSLCVTCASLRVYISIYVALYVVYMALRVYVFVCTCTLLCEHVPCICLLCVCPLSVYMSPMYTSLHLYVPCVCPFMCVCVCVYDAFCVYYFCIHTNIINATILS